MKFRDLFLPKIARSDPKVRKEAVLEETNVELLAKVIENDSDKEVRRPLESACSASPVDLYGPAQGGESAIDFAVLKWAN